MTVLTMTTTHNTAPNTTVPNAAHFLCPAKVSTHICLLLNVHNNRISDSAHFARPMSHNSTYTSPSLVHLCNNIDQLTSTCIVSYIGRQYARTVPNVDIVGSSKCHTRHLAARGLACFNYVLVTNSSPDGQVNPYPNKYSVQYGLAVRGTSTR
jgi:hypothetical protein